MDGPKHNSGIPQRLGGFPEVGAPFLWGPHSKEYSIFGYVLFVGFGDSGGRVLLAIRHVARHS